MARRVRGRGARGAQAPRRARRQTHGGGAADSADPSGGCQGQDSAGHDFLKRRSDELRRHGGARRRPAQRDPHRGRPGSGDRAAHGGGEAVRRARRGAFTLIEVLVALAIVAIGMAAVMGALTSSANTISYLRDKTLAQFVALNQIANLRLSGQQPPTGSSDGDTDFAGRSWHWRQEVAATEVPGVERIDISVRPAEVKAGEDNGWFTTVSGVWGDALGTPNGFQPDWGTQTYSGVPPKGSQ